MFGEQRTETCVPTVAQVYSDGTRTGWFAGVDRAHINLTGGVWMALSGKHKDQQVGTFSAQKILVRFCLRSSRINVAVF